MYEVSIEEQVIPCLTEDEADRLHGELDELGLIKINVTDSDDLWVGKQSFAGLTEEEADKLYWALDELGIDVEMNECDDGEYDGDAIEISEWIEQEYHEYYRDKL